MGTLTWISIGRQRPLKEEEDEQEWGVIELGLTLLVAPGSPGGYPGGTGRPS